MTADLRPPDGWWAVLLRCPNGHHEINTKKDWLTDRRYQTCPRCREPLRQVQQAWISEEVAG